jgi:hypothetical protein
LCITARVVERPSLDKEDQIVGIEINASVSVSANRDFFTLGQIREFVEKTEAFGDETKVPVRVRMIGEKDIVSVNLSAKYGEMTGNY